MVWASTAPEVVLDVRVERDDLAVLDVGDGEVLSLEGIGGVGAVVQEVVHAADEPGVGRPGRIAAVGLVDVDGVGLGIADEGLRLLCDLNELIGSDDVLRIVQADQADRTHVWVDGDHAGGELDGDVLGAGVVLNVPDLVLVADQHAGALLSADGVVDVQQQIHALLGSGGLAEQDRGHVALAHAAADHGIGLSDGAVGVQRNHGGDGDTLFIRAALLHGGVGVGTVAVGADAGGVVVGDGGVGVAVVGEGVGKAVAALVDAAGGVLAVLADVGNLVIAVGIVLASRHEGRTVRGIIGADIHHRAGRRTDDAQKRRDGRPATMSQSFFIVFM